MAGIPCICCAGVCDTAPELQPAAEGIYESGDFFPAEADPDPAEFPPVGAVDDAKAGLAPGSPSPTYYDLLALAQAQLVPQLLELWAPKKPREIVGTGGSYGEDYYGDGRDGDATISGTTTITRDMFYRNLAIQNGGSLKTGGFRVYVLKKLTIDSGGRLGADGANAQNASGAAGGAGGAGGGRSSAAPFLAVGGAGGNGGTSGGIGSNFGSGGGPGSSVGNSRVMYPGVFLAGAGAGGGGYFGDAAGATDAVAGGATLGADGLGGDPGSSGTPESLGGGGGGGGGGVVLLYTREIDNAGWISADGGNRGTGTTGAGGAGGAGGGGGGGYVAIFYTQVSGSGLGNSSAYWGTGGAYEGWVVRTQVNV